MTRPASEPERDGARVRFFPPGIMLIAIVGAIILDRIWPIRTAFTISAPLRYWIGGLIVVGAISGLGLRAVLLFKRAGQDPNPWKPTPQIEDRGPFRLTRNPMYLGMVLICLGFAIGMMNWWLLLLTPVVGMVLQWAAILPEEEYLEQKFGETYLAYKRRVRRWL